MSQGAKKPPKSPKISQRSTDPVRHTVNTENENMDIKTRVSKEVTDSFRHSNWGQLQIDSHLARPGPIVIQSLQGITAWNRAPEVGGKRYVRLVTTEPSLDVVCVECTSLCREGPLEVLGGRQLDCRYVPLNDCWYGEGFVASILNMNPSRNLSKSYASPGWRSTYS